MRNILIEGMTSNMGGIEKFIYTIYNNLKDEYHIDFITVDENIPFEAEFKENGSEIYRITPRHISIKQYKSDMKNVFNKKKYDVLWSNKTTLSAIDSMVIAKKNGVKKIVCHSHASKNMGSRFTYIMHSLNKKRINAHIDYKVACSTEAAEWFYGKDTDKITIIQNAVDVKKYAPSLAIKERKRKELNIKEEFVLGHIGRFSVEKNHKFLIDIFEQVYKQTDARLLLCGDGALMPEIKEYVEGKNLEEKISFLGIRNDIAEILQVMDVLVFPSLYEGLPFALVEAQAAGVPCVVSDTVSVESKLTDILEFVELKNGPMMWTEKILQYQDYIKVSKEEQLTEKGFSLDSMMQDIKKILT